jgi:hypothetical protein
MTQPESDAELLDLLQEAELYILACGELKPDGSGFETSTAQLLVRMRAAIVQLESSRQA